MRASHEQSMDSSSYNGRHQSTKNNSMSESIMVEDISELEIEKDSNEVNEAAYICHSRGRIKC